MKKYFMFFTVIFSLLTFDHSFALGLFEKTPVPEYFGFYAVEGNQLVELEKTEIKATGFIEEKLVGIEVPPSITLKNKDISFIMYSEEIPYGSLALSRLEFKEHGKAKGNFTDKKFDVATNMWLAVEDIKFKVAPVKNQSNTYRIVPQSGLKDGFYVIHAGILHGSSAFDGRRYKDQVYGVLIGEPTEWVKKYRNFFKTYTISFETIKGYLDGRWPKHINIFNSDYLEFCSKKYKTNDYNIPFTIINSKYHFIDNRLLEEHSSSGTGLTNKYFNEKYISKHEKHYVVHTKYFKDGIERNSEEEDFREIYNKNGQLTEQQVYMRDKLLRRFSNSYDQNGRISVYQNEIFNFKNKKISNKVTKYKYNNEGNTVEISEWISGFRELYSNKKFKYDSQGRIKSVLHSQGKSIDNITLRRSLSLKYDLEHIDAIGTSKGATYKAKIISSEFPPTVLLNKYLLEHL